jgi:hypothetical protein
LEQEALPDISHLIPKVLRPKEFREQANSNVRATDQYGSKLRLIRIQAQKSQAQQAMTCPMESWVWCGMTSELQ